MYILCDDTYNCGSRRFFLDFIVLKALLAYACFESKLIFWTKLGLKKKKKIN